MNTTNFLQRRFVRILRTVFLIAMWLCTMPLLRSVCVADEPAVNDVTIVDVVEPAAPPINGLGTMLYAPSEKEKLLFEKLDANEVTTGGLGSTYDIRRKNKQFVSWFGIVRKIEADKAANTTRLLLEHKYFDGLTDLHQQTVSFNGSGDFEAIITGTDHPISDLELVRVYGPATIDDPQNIPVVNVQFARCWPWGTFAFIFAEGEQRGSDQWRKLNQVALDDIYSSRPDEEYYTMRVGAKGPTREQRELQALALQAASALKFDVTLLRQPEGVLTKLIEPAEFRQRAKAAAMKLQPRAEKQINAMIDSIVQADYTALNEYIDQALELNMHDATAAVMVEALVLNDDDDTAATDRLNSLGYAAGKCVPALIDALRCEDDWARGQAAQTLGDAGDAAEYAIPALIMALADRDEFVRSRAAEALSSLGLQPNFSVPALALALKDTDDSVRFDAASGLGSFETQASAAALALAHAVEQGGDPAWAAAFSLGKTRNTQVALPVLIKSMQIEDRRLQRFAAMGLGELGTAAKTAMPVLLEELDHKDAGVRIAAAEAVWKITGNTQTSLPVLETALDDGFPQAMWAANSMETFGPSAAPCLPALLKATDDKNSYVRSACLGAIVRIVTETTGRIPRLTALLDDESQEVRAYAAVAIWKTEKSDQMIPLLIQELEKTTEENGDTPAVIRALGMIGKPAESAVPGIRDFLTDQDKYTRRAARDALKQF